MRYLIIFLDIFFLMLSHGVSGVIHETKSTVQFQGLGRYTTHDLMYIQGMKQYKETSGNFEGQGMMGQMISGAMFGPNSKAQITDLEAMKIFQLFREKKQYREMPIEKISFETTSESNEKSETGETSEQSGESPIKITRQEFRVLPTHKSKVVHGFPCQEYQVIWVTEWKNTETGEKGKDSLFTDVWSTKKTANIEKGLQEEMNFQKLYLKKVGIKVDFNTQSILGLNWLKMFQGMKQRPAKGANFNSAKWTKEMAKIKGYPVLIDGEFYASTSGKKQMQSKQKPEGFDFNNPGGMFGSMFKKKIKQAAKEKLAQKPNKREPVFAFHTELIKIEAKHIEASQFKVPADYQKID